MTTENKQTDKPVVNVVAERSLAVVGGQTLTLPNELAKFADENGNQMTTKKWLQKHNGLPIDPKQKLTDLKAAIGKDKAKLQIKEYNSAKPARRAFDTKIWALVGADATLRKSVKAVVNAKGSLIGFNGSARFTKDADAVGVLMDEVTQLRAQLAKLLESKQAPALAAK